MAEDELVFDMNMKKKKKKKKTGFDLDATTGEENTPKEEETEKKEEPVSEPQETEPPVSEKSEEPLLDDDFSNFTKKKKKKKKVFDLGDMEEALPQKEENDTAETDAPRDEADTVTAPSLDDDLSLSLPSKKRKKKKVTIMDADIDTIDSAAQEKTDEQVETPQESSVWSQHSDKDYTYEELLGRVFDIMRDKNPEMVSGEKKRFVMKPPQVMRAGARKTSFSNFSEICKALHRMPKHLLAYLLSELGTSGSIDGSNQLIIKGRFQQKQIEHVLRRYIKEYVTCHTCRSPDTILQKDTRLYFLQCETCGSRCSVASIKSGFQAVTGRRAAMRARET